MFAVFENAGVLDTRLVTTLGTNVKPDCESPIGYFGTGLKLALAVCARLNYPTYVQFGDGHTYMLHVSSDNVRGKDFSFLSLEQLDGDITIAQSIKLPFTTEFGKNWEPWMVLRELESNMRDEVGGKLHYATVVPPPNMGTVRFIIGGEFAAKCEEYRRHAFFDVAHQPIYSDDNCDIALTDGSGAVFYRGIRVGTYKPMLYTYNLKQHIDLTEDRTFKYYWEVESAVGTCIKQCKNEDILSHVLTAKPNTWEADSNDFMPSSAAIEWPDQYPMQATFLRVALRVYEKQPRLLNNHVYKAIRDAKGDREPYELARTTVEQRAQLRSAISLLYRLGYDIKRYQVIVTAATDNNGRLGWVHMNDPTRIFISPLVFEQGYECLVGTLLEEYCHLDTGHRDCSRSMQDWLVRHAAMHMIALGTKAKRKR